MVRAGRYMELEAKGKRSRASSDILAGDRLSALPDCIIHHIMSFMKARQVVQTCVLSTRWTNLWRSVLCLDVDEEEFRNQGRDYTMDEELEKFEDFTDHLLIPNNISISSLDMFRLHVTDRYRSGKQSAKWIRHGVKYSTRAPDIQVKGLSSNSWRIKRLHLSNVHLDDNFTKHVSSGCPYLECLELKAPAVAYLFLALNRDQFEVAGGVSIDEMPFLVKASVDLQGILCKNQTKLLGSFSNVTSLELLRFPAKFSNSLWRMDGMETSSSQGLKRTEIIYKDEDLRQLVKLLSSN
ncbi:hypothetical protein PR202_ga20257 [Eleusine coracana subsp. coracana]|uniref:F-box domain-containing protein n=1 Tax=Eleusine coracana subsp. coracana TaxID=191504 RepID=A0AAV5CXQ3_ELECO|nr:hypothetical protein PR202_ga20257 [Eleusine coracana subsp. coracana]